MNNNLKTRQLIAVCLVGFILSVQAQEHGHGARHESAAAVTDAQAIAHSMKKLFDKPDAPLAVAPVSIEGDYAVAGWIQSGKGGRALLKKVKGQWSIQVCGGDGLKQTASLVQTGMSNATADRLVKKVQSAEAKLSADQLKKLSMFEGMMKVDQAHHGAHGAHSTHEAHASHPKH
ncbi:MAG: copper uptake system-associated protein [Limnohabitans sp.]|nr:copper uptake system-associated protein [Limnohabitans sp.]